MEDYKTKVLELVEDINSMSQFYSNKDRVGKFNVRTCEIPVCVNFKVKIHTQILFDDVKTLIIITMEDYIDSEKHHWFRLYHEFLKWIIFARDNQDYKFEDYIGNHIIPIRKLIKKGYGR